MKDYYEILGVPKDAPKEKITENYHKLVHIYHPDMGGSNGEKCKELNEAYKVLSDRKKRAEYDAHYEQTEHGQSEPKSHVAATPEADKTEADDRRNNEMKKLRLALLSFSILAVGMVALIRIAVPSTSPNSTTAADPFTMNATAYKNAVAMLKLHGVTNPMYLKNQDAYTINFPNVPDSVNYSDGSAPVANQPLWVEDILAPGVVLVSYVGKDFQSGADTIELSTVQIPGIYEYASASSFDRPITCEAQASINLLRDNLEHEWITIAPSHCYDGPNAAEMNKSCLPPYWVEAPRNEFSSSILSNADSITVYGYKPDLSAFPKSVASNLVDVSSLIVGNGWGLPPTMAIGSEADALLHGRSPSLYDWSASNTSDAQLKAYQGASAAAQSEHLGLFSECPNATSGI